MPKGVGKALERVMATEKREETEEMARRDKKIDFLNKNRQEIFQYLCQHPGSHITMISKAMGLSFHATNWHLRRLVESTYITRTTRGKKVIFYPTNMIAEEDVPLFELLNSEKAKAICLLIIERPGISQGEICKALKHRHQVVVWYTKKLEKLDLISSLEDGKFRRYYPTDLLNRKREENAERLRIFRESVIKKFRSDMLSPKAIKTTKERFVVRIFRGRNRATLILHTDPFVTVLS